MWLNRNGITNLLLIPQLVQDGYIIDYNTARNWVVMTPEGKEVVFQQDTGLCHCMPYIDLCEYCEGVIMLKIVRKNFEGYTKRQVKKAILACEAQVIVAHPPNEKFKQMVGHENPRNCNVKVEDITNAQTVFGPSRSRLKVRVVSQKLEQVDPEYTVMPRNFYDLDRFVNLMADVMFVNGIPFRPLDQEISN